MTKFEVKPAAQPQPNPYLPLGPPDPLLFEDFEGINTQTTRPGVDDKQMAWCDGWMPIAKRKLRTMYGVGEPMNFASSGTTVSFFAFANIGATRYCISVMSNGAIIATNTVTYGQTFIASPGIIQNPSRLNVGLTQYGSKYVIIVSAQANGYFIWDGTQLYLPGNVFPAGGLIPTGISGTTVEIYAGRVWIGNGATLTFSAPGSVVDFTSGSGGGNATSSDSFLRVRYIQLVQTNGFLYLIADSSINYISGVQTSGSPPTTTYTNQNADPEVGTPWPSTVQTFGRSIVFGNAFGAHASYGGAVAKISDMLDGIYNTVPDFGGFIPSAAKAIIFGKRVWILLLPIIDPISAQQVNKMFLWDGKRWWASPQEVTITYIQSQEVDSVLTAWGSTGTAIYPMFQRPTVGFTKIAQSKLWDKNGGYMFNHSNNRLFGLVQYYSSESPDLRVSIDNETGSAENELSLTPLASNWETGATPVQWFDGASEVTWYNAGSGITVIPPTAIGQQGVLQGFTVETECADMALISLAMDSKIVGYRG